MRMISLAVAATVAFTAVPAFAQTVTYNSAPAGGFFYGAGNDYTPANAAVLTNGNTEIALRLHQRGEQAPASDGTGTYSFALGTTPINFDWSLSSDTRSTFADALITVSNIGTGQTASYNPFFAGNDNSCLSSVCQNSARLNFGFLLGSGFTPNVDSSYSVTFAAGGNSLTTVARLGAGAVAAVPEPSTWALMLLGFGGMGVAMRRQRRASALPQVA